MFDDESALEFKRQLKLIALGALIGFVPAFMNTLLQNRFQRQENILTRRLTLIQSLSSVNEKAASILARANNLQRTVDSAAGGISIQDALDLKHRSEEVEEDSIVLNAEMKNQLTVLGAVYGRHTEVSGYEWMLTPLSQTRPKGGELAEMHDSLERTKANLVTSMRRIENICQDIADSVNQ